MKENKEAENKGSEDKVLIKADNLVKIYKTKETEVLALQGLDLSVERGELTAIIGNSGSGKSTFLNMIGGLDRPSAGSLFVAGGNLFTMSEKELVRYKRNTVGFVWQNNGRNMLPFLSALENVMMPMYLSSSRKKREKTTAVIRPRFCFLRFLAFICFLVSAELDLSRAGGRMLSVLTLHRILFVFAIGYGAASAV